MRVLFVGVLIFIVASLGLAGFYVTKSSGTSAGNQQQVLADSTVINSIDLEILARINKVRSDVGVGTLIYSPAMKELTAVRVNDMAEKQYYSHRSPEGYDFGDIIHEYDSASRSSCENLQLQVGDDWQMAIDAWIASSAHYKCLVNPKLTKAGGSISSYGEINYDNSSASKQMYVFAFIATN